MIVFSNPVASCRPAAFRAACVAILFVALIAAAAARPDEPPSDSVGVIDGEAIRVTGPMSVEVVRGQVRTVLRSGSDVRVKSGTARIDLVEGGQISICGPAHLSVLKSRGSLTIALDTGTIHVHIERDLALTVYTPQIQAQTVAIGNEPRDALVGFDTSGAMCIRANRGAVRVEQQLTGYKLQKQLLRRSPKSAGSQPPRKRARRPPTQSRTRSPRLPKRPWRRKIPSTRSLCRR